MLKVGAGEVLLITALHPGVLVSSTTAKGETMGRSNIGTPAFQIINKRIVTKRIMVYT